MSPSAMLNVSHSSDDTLPDSRSPTLALAHPTATEKAQICQRHAASWRGALSLPAYHRREAHLHGQLLTRDDGITHWILIDAMEPPQRRRVLASCETIRKKALVAITSPSASAADADAGVDVEVRDTVAHGVGSVFCAEHLRGRGYAARMMKELDKALRTWQVDGQVRGREECLFTVLYSDIGKKFYASHGWHPFPSTHLCLSPTSGPPLVPNLPASRPIYSSMLSDLCLDDERLIRNDLASPTAAHKIRVALIPNVETMFWHHAREEFVAGELWSRCPEVKGAMVGPGPGSRVWCLWTRAWYSVDGCKGKENTLHILRIVVDMAPAASPIRNGETQVASNGHDACVGDASVEDMVVALLYQAQKEAAEWGMTDVHVWNPTGMVCRAAQRLLTSALDRGGDPAMLVDREMSSIACLRWYGEDDSDPTLTGTTWSDIEWIINEKYAWC